MDVLMEKVKKNPITKTWNRCWSLRTTRSSSPSSSSSSSSSSLTEIKRSKSLDAPREEEKLRSKFRQVSQEGFFSVLVGAEKRRFAVRTEYVNHPMFRLLLEDAESEYGFRCDGPIVLPCDADLFYRILAEMESGGDDDAVGGSGCGFGCSPARRRHSISGCGSYSVVSDPSGMIKRNQF